MNTTTDFPGGLVTPDLVARLSKLTGVDAAAVDKAVKILVALAVASMARKTATPAGAADAMEALPEEKEPGLVKSLLAALKGEVPGELPADKMQAIYGGGANAMMSFLGKKLGFPPGPLATLFTPLLDEQLAITVKDRKLDAAGFAGMFREANDAFLKEPANAEAAALVREAIATGDQAGELRLGFTEHELREIGIAPMSAYCLVALASPSGVRGTIEEMKAANQVSTELLKEVAPVSLLGTVFGGGLGAAAEKELQERSKDDTRLVETIRGAISIVKAKAAGELESFRSLVRGIARGTAEASKEGGFLGFGGVQVSAEEREALGKVEAALE